MTNLLCYVSDVFCPFDFSYWAMQGRLNGKLLGESIIEVHKNPSDKIQQLSDNLTELVKAQYHKLQTDHNYDVSIVHSMDGGRDSFERLLIATIAVSAITFLLLGTCVYYKVKLSNLKRSHQLLPPSQTRLGKCLKWLRGNRFSPTETELPLRGERV
jgi:hypothetical protein